MKLLIAHINVFAILSCFTVFSVLSLEQLVADISNVVDDSNKYCPNDQQDACQIGDEDNNPNQECFRAAIYEYDRQDTKDCHGSALINLDAFRTGAKLAATEGAKIFVTPEDGIFASRRNGYVNPCLEEIPDPNTLNPLNDNPCNQPQIYKNFSILTELSCIARDNKIYVVANYGTKLTCQPGSQVGERPCPEIGYFMLNTDVVLDPSGKFVSRYRKYNPFTEVFNKPPEAEFAYFDTPLGRFGVVTCFDILFKTPTIDLVEKYNIDTMLFPTWWFDELPLLTAIQFQDAWSLVNKVNLLAANILKPQLGSTGSGIFSNIKSHYIGSNHGSSKILIANIPKRPRDSTTSTTCKTCFNSKTIELQSNTSAYRYTNYTVGPEDRVVPLTKNSDTREVCLKNGQFCCKIFYDMSSHMFDEEVLKKIVIIVRDGRRNHTFGVYEQVCALATLDSPFDSSDLKNLHFSSQPLVSFNRLSIEGTFASKYVYPIAAHSASSLVPRDYRFYGCKETNSRPGSDYSFKCRHEYTYSKPAEIYSFGLLGRLYSEDIMKYDH